MKTFERIDLTPNKQGYTPERHPTKKQKVGKAKLNYDTDDSDCGKTGESFVFKESKSKYLKKSIKPSLQHVTVVRMMMISTKHFNI